MRHVPESPELRGIVMRSFGSGNAPQKPWLLRLLKDASLRGVTIVNITQCIWAPLKWDAMMPVIS